MAGTAGAAGAAGAAAPTAGTAGGGTMAALKKNRKKLLAGAVVFTVALGVYWRNKDVLTVDFLQKNQHKIDTYVKSNFFSSCVSYIICMSLMIGLTMPGATFLSLMAGMNFL